MDTTVNNLQPRPSAVIIPFAPARDRLSLTKAQALSADTRWSRYTLFLWGEMIVGTKREIQSFGIAVDQPFPGETGAPKRCLRAVDLRGLPVRVERDAFYLARGAGVYCASISYPDREPQRSSFSRDEWQEHSSGVGRCEWPYADVYRGSMDALVAAGIVAPGRFPGQPGMRRTVVTIMPSGAIVTGCPHVPGGRSIRRVGTRGLFEVVVHVPRDVEAARRAEAEDRHYEWRMRCERLPVPAALPGRLLRRDER